MYHFISYVPKDGYVYELDGTRPGPIRRGKSENEILGPHAHSLEKKISLHVPMNCAYRFLVV